MIFVTLGTQDKPFKRLLEVLENSHIDDHIVAQIGCTDFVSSKMELYKYLDKSVFDKYIDEADVIITHAGVGSIMSALMRGKKIIACPRLKKYGEHTNDHQLQITKTFVEEGFLLGYYDGDNLVDVYTKIKTFTPKEYQTNNEFFVKKLQEYLGI